MSEGAILYYKRRLRRSFMNYVYFSSSFLPHSMKIKDEFASTTCSTTLKCHAHSITCLATPGWITSV